jgi:hypothetical protein
MPSKKISNFKKCLQGLFLSHFFQAFLNAEYDTTTLPWVSTQSRNYIFFFYPRLIQLL